MRRALVYLILLTLILPSCSKNSGSTVTVVKPKYHHSWFNRKKDKRVKRVKMVKMKN